MRAQTMEKIEALHAEIAALLDAEKLQHDADHPRENSLWRTVNHTRIEFMAHSPRYRSAMQQQAKP